MRPELRSWLAQRFPGAEATLLVGDASTRRFFRLAGAADGVDRIVMDYGEPFTGESDDQRMTEVFLEAGLPVPRVLDASPAVGCLVLEDLGDRLLESWVATEGPLRGLERAVDLAAAIATRGTPVLARSYRAEGPRLDGDRFRFEMEFFRRHFLGGWLGRGDLVEAWTAPLDRLAELAAAGPAVLCHRDYHSRNLMVRADGSLALVDIQDARWGPDSYDLASILWDAYLEIDPDWRPGLVDRYLAALPGGPERDAFVARLEVVAAERMIKALGTFGYQIGVLGRTRYEDAVPRTLTRLERLLPGLRAVPELGDLVGHLNR